jgi:hypothetical protein
MPAAYAHLTLVNLLAEPARLEAIPGLPRTVIPAVLKWFKFTELGAVSPDYPYLALGDHRAQAWADLMHYEETVAVLAAGVEGLRTLRGDARQKGTAWLLGYAAHVATDVAVHPVVQLRVGPYAENKTAHRECEMHQDAYIFPRRMRLGEIGLSEHLASGIGQCGDPRDPDRLDPAIETLWRGMLQATYPDEFRGNRPDFTGWREGFRRVVDGIAEEGDHFLPLSRHVATGLSLLYPRSVEVERSYVADLPTPAGTLSYDALFDRTIEKVGSFWAVVAQAAVRGEVSELAELGAWNLDTGQDPTGAWVYWA